MSKVKKFLNLHLHTLWWFLLIFIVSHVPGGQLPEKIVLGLDKLIHLGLYMVLSFLFLVGEGKRINENFYKSHYQFVAVGISVLLGVGLEFYQLLIAEGRNFDMGDIIANTVGVLLGWLCFTILYKSILRQEI